MNYCSKIYKEKNYTPIALGDTQKILNLVTEDELKSYESRYCKKINILDDSREHKPPTLVEKKLINLPLRYLILVRTAILLMMSLLSL